MSKTFRNVVSFGDDWPSRRPDKSRLRATRVRCGWTDTIQRGNRRAVRQALSCEKYDEAMDIGAPVSLQWDRM